MRESSQSLDKLSRKLIAESTGQSAMASLSALELGGDEEGEEEEGHSRRRGGAYGGGGEAAFVGVWCGGERYRLSWPRRGKEGFKEQRRPWML